MLEKLFGTPMAALTTGGIVLLAGSIGWHIVKRRDIRHWGRSIAVTGVVGLGVCFAAIFRDDYVDSIVATTDPTVTPGLFPVDSGASYLASVGGATAIASMVASLIFRKQEQRRVLFFVLAGAIVVKVVVIELARFNL